MIVLTTEATKIKQKTPFVLAKNQQCLVMPVGDVHYLTEGWPQEKFVEHLRWGMDRGAMFLGMGEYIDFASASQRALTSLLRDKVKKQVDELIEEQVEKLARLMEFTRGRWIGLLEGDHRWDYANGTGADQQLCRALQSPFLGTAALIRIRPHGAPAAHPEADAVIYAHHGMGSSRTQGGHLHRVEDLLKFIDADVYLMGHSHAKVSAPMDRQYVSPDGVHFHRTKLVARTGAWLRGYVSRDPAGLDEPALESRATYAEAAAYPPAAMGGLCIGIGYEKIEGSEYYRPTIHYSV